MHGLLYIVAKLIVVAKLAFFVLLAIAAAMGTLALVVGIDDTLAHNRRARQQRRDAAQWADTEP